MMAPQLKGMATITAKPEVGRDLGIDLAAPLQTRQSVIEYRKLSSSPRAVMPRLLGLDNAPIAGGESHGAIRGIVRGYVSTASPRCAE